MKDAKPEATGTSRRRDEERGEGAGRTPAGLSPWLNADLFKRIVHRPANLAPASAAEHDGANLMRVSARVTRR